MVSRVLQRAIRWSSLVLLWPAGACQQQPKALPSDALIAIRLAEPVVVDGSLSDPGWRAAPPQPLRRSDGGANARQATTVRLAWTDQELLLAFQCQDQDIHTRFEKRDDPLYLEEAIEVFLDTDGDRRDYMEFEVSPAGVLFDAAFTARRQGMDLGFNPRSRVAVEVDGTLARRDDRDQGWSVELAIPFADMRGGGRRPPKPGDCWRANLFRLDKSQGADEASSWRPTRGDFHDLDAFGALCFR